MSFRRRPGPRRGRALLLVTPALAAPLLLAGPAAAHTELVDSEPGRGATVRSSPAQVRLQFNEPLARAVAVVVSGPDGQRVEQGGAELEGDTVRQRLGPLSASGSYSVAYRVTADDGHPLTGRFAFTYRGADAGSAGAPDAEPSGAATATGAAASSAPEAGGAPAAPAAPAPAAPAPAAPAPAASTRSTGASPSFLVPAGLLALLGVLLGASVAAARSRRARTP